MNLKDTRNLFLLVVIAVQVNGIPTQNLTTIHPDDLHHQAVQDVEDDSFKYWECRRNPTWKTGGVEYKECQRLTMGEDWKPRHQWIHDTSCFENGEEETLRKCLDDKISDAMESKRFARCAEDTTDAHECEITEMSVATQYKHHEDGELAVVRNVFTLQEAFALNALSECVEEVVGDDHGIRRLRVFAGNNADEKGLYKYGGNYVTFLTALLQIYLPGSSAAIYNAFETAHQHLGWDRLDDAPPPKDLGVRTAEFLEYSTNGRLGLHVDEGSQYSISVALDESRGYEGGYFQLEESGAIFKAPRLSAIVFRSLDLHGVTPIEKGERNVFVLELWDDDDVPAARGRPHKKRFEEIKKKLKAEVGGFR